MSRRCLRPACGLLLTLVGLGILGGVPRAAQGADLPNLGLPAAAPAREPQADPAPRDRDGLQNPFTPENVLIWAAERGPRLLLVAAITFLLHVAVNILSRRIVVFITRKQSDGAPSDREDRANTLVSVFHSTAVLVLYAAALLMTLDIAGVPIAPLLGGAAVAGLAVAFAAQSLIKDYFYGFMILLEDQYSVNDVVKIGGITGFVERITLRVTVLRDFDAVHFVPHGQITTVSNLTYRWSRAVFDINVSYSADVDRVMGLLVELGNQMRQDAHFGSLILDDPEMLGVDAFDDSAVTIKFLLKTKPLKQWEVKRELLRRIKKRFDEEGIEIPFPQRVVHLRRDDRPPAPESGA